MSTEPQLPRAARIFVVLCRAAARQRLCRRAGADDGVPCRDRTAGPAQHGGHQAGGAGDARPAARAARDLRPAVRHPFPRQRGDRACRRGRRGNRAPAGRGPRRGRTAAGRRGQRVRARPQPAPRRWSSAASPQARPPMPCAAWRARPRAACRGGAAIAACAPAAGRLPICAAPCARAVRSDGEVLRLGRLKRRTRPRKILLLIDVSGSMKGRTDDNMKLAHALVQAVAHVEVFTFGTRLTRVTRALRLQAPRAGAGRRRRIWSAIGTAAPASATRCRHSSRCPASAAMRAARPSSFSPTGWSAANPARCATPSQNCRGGPGG